MGCSTLIGLLLIVITLVYFWIRKKFSFFEENGFLHDKPIFPFGNLKGVGKEIHISTKIKELYDKFHDKAPAFGMYLSVATNVVVTDLEVIKNVLVREFDTFHNRGVYSNVRDDPLSGHLFTIEDEAWKIMRAKVTPTFTSGKMKMMFGTVRDISDIMIAQLKSETSLEMIEMKNVLGNFTTDVIGNVAFGLEMNSIKDPDSMFRKMGKKIFKQDTNMQVKIFLLNSFRDLGRKLRCRFVPADVADFFLGTIKETVDYRLKKNIQRNDVMDLLLKISDNGQGDEGKLSFHELAAQCFIFFVAGKFILNIINNFVILSDPHSKSIRRCVNKLQVLKRAAQHHASCFIRYQQTKTFRRSCVTKLKRFWRNTTARLLMRECRR